MGSSRLLLGAIVVAVLVSSGIAAALVTFEARTLPAEAQREFQRSGSTSIDVSAQITQDEATTDGRVIAAAALAAAQADVFTQPAEVSVGQQAALDPA